jgi:hypothetical protein
MEAMSEAGPPPEMLFNSALERGIRSLVVLDACHPELFDLGQLTWLTFLVVHSGDIGGPESLHPPLPDRGGELLVSRSIVDAGLQMLRRLHYVTLSIDPTGVRYQASDSARPFVELLSAPYSVALRERAKWLSLLVQEAGIETLRDRLIERIGRWPAELTVNSTRVLERER